MMSENEAFDTSIALKFKWFKKIERGEKTVHIEDNNYNVEEGEIIRFMNGYDPENGSVLRELVFRFSEIAELVPDGVLEGACVDREWLAGYVDSPTDKVYIYVVKEGSDDE